MTKQPAIDHAIPAKQPGTANACASDDGRRRAQRSEPSDITHTYFLTV
jgi:hypothetical protein